MRIIHIIPILVSILFFACSIGGETQSDDLHNLCVVFVGASITEGWNFVTYFPDYNFHQVIHYGPDKPAVWSEVEAYNPDIVTFKQCGAYYDEGGDTDLTYLYNIAQQMVSLIQGIGAIAVPATTMPIDPGFDSCTQAQLDDIVEYNDWLRNYCSTNGLTCMDYYTQLADEEGQLPYEYHEGDGLHINDVAYALLSPYVIDTLESCLAVQTDNLDL